MEERERDLGVRRPQLCVWGCGPPEEMFLLMQMWNFQAIIPQGASWAVWT